MNILRLELYSTRQLQEMVDTHECTLSPEDGCDCILVRNEIDRREGIDFDGWHISQI